MNKKQVSILEHAKATILAAALSDSKYFLQPKTKEELFETMEVVIHSALDLGEYSYDPIEGEITVSIPFDAEFFKTLDDDVTIGQHVKNYFTDKGWAGCTIVPRHIGVKRTLLRLKHPDLANANLNDVDKKAISKALDNLDAAKVRTGRSNY